jgi:hypothetical protein
MSTASRGHSIQKNSNLSELAKEKLREKPQKGKGGRRREGIGMPLCGRVVDK